MSEGIGQVNNVAGARASGEALPAHALERGALTMFEDNEIVFTGNGETTPAQVMNRAIEVYAKHDAALAEFNGSPDAGVFAALDNLAKHNPHLKGQSPEHPVPVDQQFFARGGDELKKLLAPFKNNLAQLRQVVADAGTAYGGGKSVTTGSGVYSQGRTLPTSGEPEADPAEVMARMGIKPG